MQNLIHSLCMLAAGLTLASVSNLAAADKAEQPVEYEWVKVTMNAQFAPRDGAGALSFQGKMWLIGGWNPNPAQRAFFPLICNNEVWNSSNGKTWNLIKPNSFKDASFDKKADWEGRHTAGYAVFRDHMWIVGGDANQKRYQNDVWKSADGRNWELLNREKPVPWGPRVLHYTVVHDDQIWVIGGQTMPGFVASETKEIFYRDVWTTRDGVVWKELKPVEPCWSARGMIGGAAVFRGRIWILGGGTYNTPQTPTRKFHNDVWSSADGVHWKRHVETAPWAPRQYHDVAVWDDRLWVMEGYNKAGGNRNDVWHSPNGVNWREVPDTPWKPRHAASVFVHAGSLWMVAGNNMQSDVWRLRRK